MCEFQQTVQHFFRDFGRLVAKWPLLFILCSSAAALALTAGFAFGKTINEDDDQFRLFLPENAESIRDLGRLRSQFPISLRDAYDVFQSSYAYAIAVSDGDDALRRDGLGVVAELVDRIKRIRVRVGWMEASWSNLCVKDASGRCLEHPVVTLLNSSLLTDDRLTAVRDSLTYPTARFGDRTIDNSLVFGSVTVGAEGRILKARALRLPFLLQAGTSAERRTLNELWQREFLRVVRRTRADRWTFYVSSSLSWRDEMDRNGSMLASYLPALFAVLLVFSVICCCTCDWITSQPWLGVCGLLSAVMAVSSAFGVLFYFQYQYLQVVIIMPFLVLSVSVDNAFLMLNAWRASSAEPNLERRVSAAISNSAVSILITALTDGLSFAVGSASQFPAVRIFCTYCAVAILFAFVYQMTFFAACLTFCGRRELAARHCLTLRRVPKYVKEPRQPSFTQKCKTISEKFSAVLAAAMDKNAVKVFIVFVYIVYLGTAIYGVSKARLRLDMSDLVPYDSYVIGERAASDAHFSDYQGYAQAVVFTEQFEFHHPATLALLINAHERLCDTAFSSGGEFWLSEFARQHAERSFASEAGFLDSVRSFLDRPSNAAFRDDVAWSESGRSIRATRMFVRLRRVAGGNQSAAADALRRRFAASRLRGFVTDPVVFVLADQSDAVLGCVLQDAAVATAVIIVVVLLFLPRLLCAVWIGASVLSINAGVLGYLTLWRVRVDVVSMMTTVMSVGLSVDYVAHVTYHYLITKGSNSYGRLRAAFEHAGWSSVQSAAATILGASTLAFVDSYMVHTFVKTVVLVVSLGLLHGLFFLPVALSVFVPADQYLETNNYGRVRAYISDTIPGSARRRLASYFAHRPATPINPSTARVSEIEKPNPEPGESVLQIHTNSSLPWTSTSSKSVLVGGRATSIDYPNTTISSRSPLYDTPPPEDSPEKLSESKVCEVVQIVLKSKRSTKDGASDELKTFQSNSH